MSPLVSIIIPCFNQAVFLPKAIASLQAQTLTDWECIIIDDGSTDSSAAIAQKIANNDKRICVIQKENGGSASARDAGLLLVKGKYIQFLDADDTITPEKLEKQVAFMVQNGLDISYTAFCSESSNGLRSSVKSIALTTCRLFVLWGIGASTPIHAFMYSTDFIKKHDLCFQSECRYREDWKWHISCFLAKPKQLGIPDYCGAIYYHFETSKTSSYIKMQKGNFVFMAHMIPQLNGWNKFLWTYRISEELWIWLLRMMKYRSTDIAHTITPMYGHKEILFISIALMPISTFNVLGYFIKTYITK